MLARMHRAPLILALLLAACGADGEIENTPEETEETAEETEAAPEEEPETAEAEPRAEPVDLLQSAATDLAVSSAYHDQESQVAKLVDGDLETAWNSNSGDLVGAWIDVRLPEDATVTSIRLTAGFTHRTERADLFTGNHRVTRVRVLRDGEEVGSYPLDAESRELQTLPVEGPGGVYRIELAEVLAGSHDDWTEACISELEVMGRAPGAEADTRYPRLAIGELPAPRSTAAPDDATIAAENRRQVIWFDGAWREHEDSIHYLDQNTGEPDPTDDDVAGFRRARRRILERVAEMVAPVDDAASDALRRRRAHGIDWGSYPARRDETRADLDAIAAAFDAVAAHLDQDEVRCRWARAHAGIRVKRLENAADYAWQVAEGDAEFGIDDSAASGRRQDRIGELRDTLTDVGRQWSSNAAGMLPRLRRIELPEMPDSEPDLAAMNEQLTRAGTACGWSTAGR